MEKLKHGNYVYTTDHCTDIEEDENIIQRKDLKVAKKDNYITPIYDLNGKLSKRNNSSSDEEEESTNEDELTDESSMYEVMPKRQKVQSNILKESYKNHKAKLPTNDSIPAHPEVVKNIKISIPETATSSNVMNYLKRILADVGGLKYDQKLIRNDIHVLKNKLEQYITKQDTIYKNQHNLMQWTEENNIKWPLKTKEEYDKLNELLNNGEIRKDFMSTIEFIIDSRTPLSKNLLAVIRKFLHRDLATKFNCVKQTKDKFTLKPSPFYNCIIEVLMTKSIRGSLQEVFSEKTLDQLIGVILTNSKDWEKRRSCATNINNIAEEIEQNLEEDEENMCDKENISE